MKRFALLAFALCALAAGQTFAQDTSLITLDQTNPYARMSITLPENTTGVLSMDVSQASVQIADANNNLVFTSADPRVHLIELSIAPNTGAHTLTVQRLPGVDTAALQVSSQADLTSTGTSSIVDVSTLGFQQSQTLPLTSANPGGNVTMTIPQGTTGVMTATFIGATATAEVTDSSGTVLAAAYRDIDGFNLILDGGSYQFGLLANGLVNPVSANVQVMPATQFSLLAAPAATAQMVTAQSCTASIAASSVSLRSGPGTGYSVLNYGYLGETYQVGGVNPDSSWMVIGGGSGSAWVSRDLLQLNGDCASLQVFNVPFRDAQPAQIILQPAPSTGISNVSNPPSRSWDEDEHESEHESDYESD